jgi:hypothetical protein
LQQRLGLKKADLPLVGIITRLTHQKGIHLIKHAIWRTLERGGQVLFYPISCFSSSLLIVDYLSAHRTAFQQYLSLPAISQSLKCNASSKCFGSVD